jgi:hypothetical protein
MAYSFLGIVFLTVHASIIMEQTKNGFRKTAELATLYRSAQKFFSSQMEGRR